MDLYERIRDIAKCKGVSINKMESDLEFARSYISKFRKITPGSDVLEKIADYLDESVDTLLGRDNDDSTNQKNNPMTYDKMLQVYTRGKNNLTHEERMKLAQIILSDRND